MPLKALLFDVDGTLAETEELHRICFEEAFANAGHDWEWPRDIYRDLLKITGGKERILHYLDRMSLDIGADAATRVAALHAEKNRLYALRTKFGVALRPGVRRLITEARGRGVAVAIATTTSRSNLDALLAAAFGRAGAAWFSAIVTGEDVSRKKPDPSAYLQVLGLLGLAPSECVAFEDSLNGLVAAKTAGLPVVLTPSIYTEHENFTGADCVVSDLGEPGRPLRHIAGWRPKADLIDVPALQALLVARTGERARQ
ncbi:HAD-IA family hydrolase (plasmid) [Mesorhizobium sp. AaZ16]|uniref:HAD-IA family hydrolase n=1 Tax=Mesorhizobium sp. AaZ16 TaxID=3402289 RepID=UPI00374E797D